MEELIMKLPDGVKAALSVIAVLWSIITAPVQALIALMFLDVFAGMLAAWTKKTLSSRQALKGIMVSKIMKLAVLVAAHIVQPYVFPALSVDFGTSTLHLVEIVAVFFIIQEVLSILENAALAGVKLPAFLTDALKEVQERLGHTVPARGAEKRPTGKEDWT